MYDPKDKISVVCMILTFCIMFLTWMFETCITEGFLYLCKSIIHEIDLYKKYLYQFQCQHLCFCGADSLF